MKAKNLSIVVIGDELSDLEYFSKTISEALPGTEVYIALDALDGIKVSKRKNPDVILIDISISKEEGLKISQIIKKERFLQATPMLFITDLESDRELRQKALKAGAEAFLIKPIDDSILITQLLAMAKIKERNMLVLNREKQLEALVKSRTSKLNQEIIERQSAEADLKASESLFKTYIEKAPVGIFVCDALGAYIDVNQAGCELMGHTKKEILSLSITDYMAPDQIEEGLEGFRELNDKGYLEAEYKVRRKGSQDYWIILRAVKINDNRLLAFCTDITERKQHEATIAHLASFPALNKNPIIELNEDGGLNYVNPIAKVLFPDLESLGSSHPLLANWQTILIQLSAHEDNRIMREIKVGECFYSQAFQCIEASKTIRIYGQDITKRKLAEKALVESEELFRTAFESSTAGVCMLDKNGKYFKVNDKACEILGYTRDELLRKTFTDITYEEDIQIGLDNQKKLISGEISTARYEKRYLRKDGSVIWAYISAAAIRDKDGRYKNMVTYIQDITEKKNAAEKSEAMLHGIIDTLARVVETRDPYTAGHQKRVAEIAVAIAEGMGLTKHQVEAIHFASIIHDLGKIQIPAEILTKPGKLTSLEYEMIKLHPQIGYDLLKNINFEWPIAEIILQHHERIDGTGYPRGLTGDEIMIEAKILSVADSIESMSSHRPYRAALIRDKVLEEIEQGKGHTYDPVVAEAGMNVFKKETNINPK